MAQAAALISNANTQSRESAALNSEANTQSREGVTGDDSVEGCMSGAGHAGGGGLALRTPQGSDDGTGRGGMVSVE